MEGVEHQSLTMAANGRDEQLDPNVLNSNILDLTGHACIVMNMVVPRLVCIISRCFVGLQLVAWEIDSFNQFGT